MGSGPHTPTQFFWVYPPPPPGPTISFAFQGLVHTYSKQNSKNIVIVRMFVLPTLQRCALFCCFCEVACGGRFHRKAPYLLTVPVITPPWNPNYPFYSPLIFFMGNFIGIKSRLRRLNKEFRCQFIRGQGLLIKRAETASIGEQSSLCG